MTGLSNEKNGGIDGDDRCHHHPTVLDRIAETLGEERN
jgi:hypothetical protein